MRGVLSIAAAALVAAVSAQAAGAPALKLAKLTPLVLDGSRFQPREPVRITVVAGPQRAVKRVTATSTGSFTATFSRVTVSRCEAVLARAVGARGGIATVRRPPLPACMPERSG